MQDIFNGLLRVWHVECAFLDPLLDDGRDQRDDDLLRLLYVLAVKGFIPSLCRYSTSLFPDISAFSFDMDTSRIAWIFFMALLLSSLTNVEISSLSSPT